MEVKKYKVVWTNLALSSLENIRNYIEGRSPQGAITVATELNKIAKSLTNQPERHQRDPRFVKTSRNIRSVSKWNYKIVYEVTENQVIIVQIFDTRQDPGKLKIK